MGPARIYRPRGHITDTNQSLYWTESQLHYFRHANPSKVRKPRAADCAPFTPTPRTRAKADRQTASVTPDEGSRSAVRGPGTWAVIQTVIQN